MHLPTPEKKFIVLPLIFSLHVFSPPFPIGSLKRQTTDCRLQTTDCGLQTADCGLPTADYRLKDILLKTQTAETDKQKQNDIEDINERPEVMMRS